MGAWIEIKAMELLSISGEVAPHMGAWIEMEKWLESSV